MLSKYKILHRCVTCCRLRLQTVTQSSKFFSTENSPVEDTNKRLDLENSTQEKLKSLQLKKGLIGITNKPFAKNLFIGKFDKDVLIYPEIQDNDEADELKRMAEEIERYFTEEIDSKSIDENAKIPEEILQQLKDFGLFGQQIPEKYGGLGLNATKFARIAEATALDGSISVTLAGHQSIGLKGLLIAGTEEQKETYLPRLSTGELVAAFCLTEPSSGSDAASIQTRATLSDDGLTYHLNGGKIWISNGGIADVFTVFAKTEVTNTQGEREDRITGFFVERDFGGVTSGKPEDKLGIRGSNTCEVHFDNTPVPVENVLGEVGGGFKLAMNILNSGRFSMGSSVAGGMKRLIAMTTEHAVTRTQFGKKLSEFGLIKEKFAKMSVKVYAVESMAYLTAGIMDMYEKPDMSVEAAMVKIFSSEVCWMCINECLQILGGQGYMKDYPYERYLRDARILMIFEGTNEILRLFVALSGVQHAGKELKNIVKKLRNPLGNPRIALKATVNKLRGKSIGGDNSRMFLNEEVHPSLQVEAERLEECVNHLQSCVEMLLTRHGNKIIDEQMDLKRLADIAIDLYAMTACISRSSRSYCIGLKNAEHELMLTKVVCQDALQNIQKLKTEIGIGSVDNLNDANRHIADVIFKNGGYAAEHPLTRNW